MNECCYVHFSLHLLLEASLEIFSKMLAMFISFLIDE
jgi:hypothetical protein